jgi:hypothetical protein
MNCTFNDMHAFHLAQSRNALRCGVCGQDLIPSVDDNGDSMVMFDQTPVCADCAEELCPDLLHAMRALPAEVMQGAMIAPNATAA